MTDVQMLHAGRFLDLVDDDGWEYVRRTNATDVVAIIAATAADEIVLVEQFRRPVGATVIEIPAGLVGDDGNYDVAVAAQRELLEETGFACARIAVLARCPSSAGLTDETVTLVRAYDLEHRDAGGGVDGEEITVHTIPRSLAPAWLAERVAAGALIDAKVYAALYWLSADDESASVK